MMDYVARLQHAHRMEVAGEAVYATAARLTWRPNRRAKWLALAELEKQIKEEIALQIRNHGSAVQPPAFELRIGQAAGALIAALPWRLSLRMLTSIAERAVPFWEGLERDFPDGNPEFLARLTAHERAQVEFAQRELGGDGGRSLDPVVALIRRDFVSTKSRGRITEKVIDAQ
jgi:hypothetical protein